MIIRPIKHRLIGTITWLAKNPLKLNVLCSCGWKTVYYQNFENDFPETYLTHATILAVMGGHEVDLTEEIEYWIPDVYQQMNDDF